MLGHVRRIPPGLLAAGAVLALVLSASWDPAASFTLTVLLVAVAVAGVLAVMAIIALAEAATHPDDGEARRGKGAA